MFDITVFGCVFVIFGVPFLFSLCCKNSATGMIKEIGFYPWSDPKRYIDPARWVRKLFRIRERVIPKFCYYELFLALFFAALGPINLIISAIANFDPVVVYVVVYISMVFQSCLIIVDTIVMAIMYFLLKKRRNTSACRTAHKQERDDRREGKRFYRDKETDEAAVMERQGLRVLDGGARKGMKKLIIDQTLLLVTGIAVMIGIPTFCGPFFTVLFEIIIIISWGYLCRRILLLPLDLISGEVSRTAYFALQQGGAYLEFFKDMDYWEWKFYFGNDQKLFLLVPIATKGKEGYKKIVQPPKDVKLKITYFRFSKILLEWERS